MAGAFDILDLAKKKVSNFFDPGEEVRVRDVVRELPGAIKKTAVDVGRGIIRDVTSVGSTFISPITGQEEIAIDPSLKKIFGDEPIETLQKRIANAELTLKDIGSKFNVDLDKAALPMAALLVGGITGADFIPMGVGAKAGLKPLIQSTAKTNLRTVTRLGRGASQKAPQVTSALRPLVQEARKFKTAEEFVLNTPIFHHRTITPRKILEEGFDISKPSPNKVDPQGVFLNKANLTEQPIPSRPGFPRQEEIIYTRFEPKNPLVLDFGAGRGPRPGVPGWKSDLQARYGGKSGKALTDALRKDGFDSIFAKEGDDIIEAVSLTPNENLRVIGTKSQLTDFYNQAVKGIKEVVPEKNLPGFVERDVDDVITELAITKNPFRKQHLQKALENKYNLKELREGIKQIAQEPFDQPKISFGTKAELIARQFAVPAEGGLTKLGNAGNILYKRSQSVADIGERRTGEFLSGYFPIRRGINRLEKERVLFDALEGRAIPQTKAGMKTANYLKEQFSKIIKEADDIKIQARLSEGKKVAVRARKNFVPHILDFKKVETPQGRQIVIEHLIRTGQTKNLQKARTLLDTVELKAYQRVPNIQKAEMLLNKFITRQRTGGAFFGSLSRVRTLDLPPSVLITDIDTLTGRYFGSVYDFLEQSRQFGQANEKIAPLLKQIAQEKGALGAQFAEGFVRNITGGNIRQFALDGAVDFINDINVATKLSLAVIPNLGQSVLTAIKVGVIPVARQLRNLPKQESRDFALRSGSTVAVITRKLMQEIGSRKFGDSVLTATGFTFVEKEINRTLTPLVGRNIIGELYGKLLKNPDDKLVLRTLKELRIEPSKLLKLGPQERFQKQAALRLTKVTQFGEGVRQMPLAVTATYWGKLLYQFKQFPINATRFIVNQVILEAKRGNPRPLIRLLTVAPIAGEVIGDISAIIRGKERTTMPAKRYLENIAYIGAIGIVWDLYQSAVYNNLAGSLAGPTIGTVSEVGGAIANLEEEKLLKTVIRQIPVVGPIISGQFLPSKAQKKARKGKEFIEQRLQPVTSLSEVLENIQEGRLLSQKKKRTKPSF